MKNALIILTFLVSALFADITAHALTIPASEDSFGYNGQLTAAGNAAVQLAVDVNRKAFIYFNLNDIPTNAVVRWAKLRLFLPTITAKGSGLSIFQVGGVWNECKASAMPFIQPYAVASIPADQLGSKRFVTADVTATVQNWISMKALNEGFAIAPTLGYYGTSSLTLTSKEGPSLGIPAELDVEFQPESKPLTVDQLPSQLKTLLTPTITSQPLLTREKILSVGATGVGDLMYQWFKNGVAISGATLSTFSAGTNSGSYSVKVSNSVIGVQTLSVFVPPEELFSSGSNTFLVPTTAISNNGKLWTWGSNFGGELGVGGSSKIVKMPSQVGSDSDWKAIFSGSVYYNEALARYGIKKDGSLWAWGQNGSSADWGGVLGAGTLSDVITVPRKVAGGSWISVYSEVAYANNDSPSGGSVGLKSDGTLWTWGNNRSPNSSGIYSQWGGWVFLTEGQKVVRVPTQVGTDSDWQKLFSFGGPSRTGIFYAIKKNGTLWACGRNKDGYDDNQALLGLGEIDALSVFSPIQIGTDTNWKEVFPGMLSTLALKNDGSLWGWGNNDNSKLGTGSDQPYVKTPERIGNDNDWATIRNYEYTYYAQKEDGSLWAWGYNNNGQLGVANSSTIIATPMRVGPDASSWKFFTSDWGTNSFAIKSYQIHG
jgi:alpha-tubulin suppressor-like RCC1 family protein